MLFNVVGKFVVLQFHFARGRSRNAVEYIPPIPEHQAKEGLVPRKLLALSKSAVWLGGKATARGVGGTCEFGECELWDEYGTTQKSFARRTSRESRGTATGRDVRHGEQTFRHTVFFFITSVLLYFPSGCFPRSGVIPDFICSGIFTLCLRTFVMLRYLRNLNVNQNFRSKTSCYFISDLIRARGSGHFFFMKNDNSNKYNLIIFIIIFEIIKTLQSY